MKKSILLFCLFLGFSSVSFSQLLFEQNDSVPVTINGILLKNAWSGGINYGQFSAIDLNFDGTKDLVIFDRTGNKILPFINNGTPNTVDYTYAPQYRKKFPALTDWALFLDYNNDGKADIFSYSQGGFSVFTNISGPGIGLFFRLEKYIVKSHYSSSPNDYLGLYVSRVDIPGLADIDFDGDIDVLTFDINTGTQLEYHRNMSMENYGVPDSLNDFKKDGGCWGNFQANFTNTVTLNVACKAAPGSGGYDTSLIDKTLHIGSSELAFDIDNDHDCDLLVGGVSYTDLDLLTNGGSNSSAHINAQQNNFPSADVPVNITIFPAPFLLDVNNDGNKDLIVAPNAGNSSENFNSCWYYKDIDTSGASTFNYQTNSFIQGDMIDVGEGAYPTFFDYDGDGLKDMLIGNYGYYTVGGSLSCKLALFKNIGSATQPAFELITRDYASLSTYNLTNVHADFGDVDGDGDADMVVGTNNNAGSILYFENLAGLGNTANFVLSNATLMASLAQQYPSPHLVDVNRDGKLDLLIGFRNGTLAYYQNFSTIGSVHFSLMSSTFGNISVAPNGGFVGYCTPQLIDEAGTYNLYVGNIDGHIYRYDSIDGNLNGSFALRDSLYLGLAEGDRVAPAITDLNNDGYLDLVVGNYSGGLTFFKGKQKVTGIQVHTAQENSPNLVLYPNPAKDKIQLTIINELPGNTKIIRVFNTYGELILYKELTTNDCFLDTENWNRGMYVCKLECGGKVVMKKFSLLK